MTTQFHNERQLAHLIGAKPALELGGRFGYFLFFSARGKGKGEPGAAGRRGGLLFLKIPGRGGGSFRGGGLRGREGVCGEFGGGGRG